MRFLDSTLEAVGLPLAVLQFVFRRHTLERRLVFAVVRAGLLPGLLHNRRSCGFNTFAYGGSNRHGQRRIHSSIDEQLTQDVAGFTHGERLTVDSMQGP